MKLINTTNEKYFHLIGQKCSLEVKENKMFIQFEKTLIRTSSIEKMVIDDDNVITNTLNSEYILGFGR